MRRLSIFMTQSIAGLLLLLAMPAGAEDAPITIAIYAPNAPFESAADRFAFINRLAQQVTSAAGVKAQGKAFARASDLEAAIKAKQVEFAVGREELQVEPALVLRDPA